MPEKICEDDFTLAHGSPREPIWEYLLSLETAKDNFDYLETDFCLVGHSHVPLVFERSGSTIAFRRLQDMDNLKLGNNHLIINPGGVGQPRDGDPRAGYAVYDTEARTVYHYRVEYDIATTQIKMSEQKLPPRLISRLSYGF